MNTKHESPRALALISVSDKSGITEFAQGLSALGIEILSTGGTARLLADGVRIEAIDRAGSAARRRSANWWRRRTSRSPI